MSIASILPPPVTNVGFPSIDANTALGLAEKNKARDIARLAKDPVVARTMQRFEQAVAKAKTPADLLKNPEARAFLLTGFGLGDQADAYGIASKALTEDPTAKDSLVARLPDSRWKTMAQALRFDKNGVGSLRTGKVLKSIEDGYISEVWKAQLDQTTPGLSKALDFKQRAASVTSVYQVLGDSTLRAVATTAAGLPRQLAVMPVDSQAAALTSKIPMKDFADPKKVDSMVRRYLMAQAAEGPVQSGPTSAALSIMQGMTGQYGNSNGGAYVLNLFA